MKVKILRKEFSVNSYHDIDPLFDYCQSLQPNECKLALVQAISELVQLKIKIERGEKDD